MPLLKPKRLPESPTAGIFSPSFPAHVDLEQKYLHGLNILRDLGFKIIEGFLTKKRLSQIYRTAHPKDMAEEFMSLIENRDVDCLIANIGGQVSSGVIPYLDFAMIRKARKIICGYSDITSLHLAIMKHAELSTFYGPAVTPSFGEWPRPFSYTVDSFLDASRGCLSYPIELHPPQLWSRELIDYYSGEWNKRPRTMTPNSGWRVLRKGKAIGPMVIANLNTLISACGTDYFPDLANHILMIEEMEAPLGRLERNLLQLRYNGAFEKISALVFGKAEFPDKKMEEGQYDSLLLEVCNDYSFPIVTDFDCAHTVPMLTLAQGRLAELDACGNLAKITIMESFVE